MEIFSQSQQDGVQVVAITGSVDALNADDVQDFLASRIKEGAPQLVADLSGLTYVSSSGLRSLLAAAKAARLAGGDLRLASTQENVQKVLEISGFTTILKVYPEVEAAVSSYGVSSS